MGSSWRQWLWAWGLGREPIVDVESGLTVQGQYYGTISRLLGRTALYVNGYVDGSNVGVYILPPDEGGVYRVGYHDLPVDLPRWPWNHDMDPCRDAIPPARWIDPWEDDP